jgi:hypothetical protein
MQGWGQLSFSLSPFLSLRNSSIVVCPVGFAGPDFEIKFSGAFFSSLHHNSTPTTSSIRASGEMTSSPPVM